jgi:hypothetical protein
VSEAAAKLRGCLFTSVVPPTAPRRSRVERAASNPPTPISRANLSSAATAILVGASVGVATVRPASSPPTTTA